MTDSKMKILINDYKFKFLPEFYNDESYVITLPLLEEREEEKSREVEELALAVERIREVFSALFPSGKPDALVSEAVRYTISCGGDGELDDGDEATLEALGEMLETPIINAMVKMQYELKYSRPFESVSFSLPSENDGETVSKSVKVTRERTVSLMGEKECDIEYLLRWRVAGICPQETAMVSFDSECVLFIENDCRCHAVFADREAMEKGKAALGLV